MKYLSLFSGIGGFEYAIHQLFPDAECVGFSEIDKYAIQTYQKNYINHVNLGDITQIDINALQDFDLLVGGSPCQDLSIAGKRKGIQGSRSGLFYKYLEILRAKKPRYFILENVASMKKEDRDKITTEMGVEPIMINAALVSAQNRKRYYWTNIPGILQPSDRGVVLKDVLGYGNEQVICVAQRGRYRGDGTTEQRLEAREDGKTNTLTTVQKDNALYKDGIIRKLTPIEYERLQCFPDGRTEGVSNSQRYKQLGNAVNTEVIKHILSYIK